MATKLLKINQKYVEIKPEIIQIAARISGVNVTQKISDGGLELCKQLGKLPFWCGDNTLHIDNPDYMDNGCCLTHTVGLPRHPATKQEMPLTPYQVEFFDKIDCTVQFTPENQKQQKVKDEIEWLRKCHLFHINKGRQMGFTEIVLRIIQFYCFSRYAGSNVAIQAGTTGVLAQKDLRRFARLFKSIPSVIEQWIKSTKEGVCVKIVNDTIVYGYPASEEAITGDTNYKCIFQDESAKWKMVDDQPVFNSIMPIIRSNGSDLFLVSTPKKPQKTFYHIHKNPDDFIKLQYDIWRTEGNLYTTEEIEEKLATKTEDPNQEYLCQFTIGKDSILGVVTDEDREKGFMGFDVDDDMDDDDSFVESEDSNERIHEMNDTKQNEEWGFG